MQCGTRFRMAFIWRTATITVISGISGIKKCVGEWGMPLGRDINGAESTEHSQSLIFFKFPYDYVHLFQRWTGTV